MVSAEVKIAEMASMLPLFIGTLLEGCEIEAPEKLNVSEEKTLMVLLKHEGNPMTEYSRKVGLTKGSFTALADRLEAKGLIKREPVSADRRINALTLTKKGKDIAQKIDAQFKQRIANRVARLEEKDLDTLKNALEVIMVTMEKLKKE